jgi:hypothetical protein
MICHDANAERPCYLGLALAELQQLFRLMELGSDFLGRVSLSQNDSLILGICPHYILGRL